MARPAPRVAPATSATRPASGRGVAAVIRPASRRPPTHPATRLRTRAHSTGHERLPDGSGPRLGLLLEPHQRPRDALPVPLREAEERQRAEGQRLVAAGVPGLGDLGAAVVGGLE